MNDLLSIRDLSSQELQEILALSEAPDVGRPLAGKGAALYFQKPSARTRNSMELAVVQLGGHPVYIREEEIGLGSRETAEDVARTLACYHSIIAARVAEHRLLEQMAAATGVPILNMLSGTDHPLQALADLLTMKQLLGDLNGARIAFIGDANNVARSLAEGSALLGCEFRIASPSGFGFSPEELERLGPSVTASHDPREAVRGAQFVYTDVWVSMGQDEEARARREALAPYQVTSELMSCAPGAWFLHCLPARRGEEVTDEVIDGPKSAVWRQAENRMHTARGAMAWLLGVRP